MLRSRARRDRAFDSVVRSALRYREAAWPCTTHLRMLCSSLTLLIADTLLGRHAACGVSLSGLSA